MKLKKETLVKKAYTVFARFEKPARCTKNHALEEAEFNAALQSVSRRSLTVGHVGTVGWGPIPSMTPEALAYFMPRLIELAVSGAIDRDGEYFYCRFINSFHETTNVGKYNLFGRDQKKVMASTFMFLCQNYQEELTIHGWLKEAQQAVENWGDIFFPLP